MKKIYSFLAALLVAVNLNAQCPLTEAVDFTVTDTEGNEHNLFNYLDDGKYVCIDFFYTTCGPCQVTAPKVSFAYEHFGCNSADIIFLGIDLGDTDEEVIAFEETYGVLYPSASGVEGGGTAVCNTYGIPAYPTIILIAPNHDIVEQDIWPIEDGQYLVDVIEPHGPSAAECGGMSTETEIISFSIPEQMSNATITEGLIEIMVEYGTNLSAIVPEFNISEGATAYINDVEQISGTSTVDFSSGAVTYEIVAEDETTIQQWTIEINDNEGIDDKSSMIFSIFPNPAKDFITINIEGTFDVKIMNVLGETVLEKQNLSSNEKIELNNIASGTYFLQIKIEEQIIVDKFTIRK